MANPFSAIPTDYHVHANGISYWANCVWDVLGIPAALHGDATIEARCAEDGQPWRAEVVDGDLRHDDGAAHFLLPFRRWYDDLIYT